MSYNTVSELAYDPSIQRRVAACAALQGLPNPVKWASDRAWQLAAQSGWSEAYASARDANTQANYQPGADESVITDEMILAAVQALTVDV